MAVLRIASLFTHTSLTFYCFEKLFNINWFCFAATHRCKASYTHTISTITNFPFLRSFYDLTVIRTNKSPEFRQLHWPQNTTSFISRCHYTIIFGSNNYFLAGFIDHPKSRQGIKTFKVLILKSDHSLKPENQGFDKVAPHARFLCQFL